MCEETPLVEQIAVCLVTDVDTVWQLLFCLSEHDVEEGGEEGGGEDAPLLDTASDGEDA